MPQQTAAGKWVLYRVDTGAACERWPVDARAMLATGDYTADPPMGADAPAATVAPPAAVPPAPDLPTEYAPGVPLVLTRAHEAAPSAPFQEPVRTAGKKARHHP